MGKCKEEKEKYWSEEGHIQNSESVLLIFLAKSCRKPCKIDFDFQH